MKFQPDMQQRKLWAWIALAFLVTAQFAWAQNLGSAPASNVAVQGQTGAQPEGAFLNFINWIGNVIAPVGAGGAVLGAGCLLANRTRFWTLAIRRGSSSGHLRCDPTHRVLDHERYRWCDLAKHQGRTCRELEATWNSDKLLAATKP